MEHGILRHLLDAVDAELHAHAHQQEAHDPGHGVYAGGTEDLADRIRQLEHPPAEQAHQGEGGHHGGIDDETVVLVGQLGNLGGAADHQGHGARPAHAGHGERHEGDALVDVDPGGLAGGGEQHAKTDEGDDEATGQPQAGNGDPEQIQDGGADEEADAEGGEQIDGGQVDLAAYVLTGHALAQSQQQGRRGGGIDHGQQREQGDEYDLEKHLAPRGGWKTTGPDAGLALRGGYSTAARLNIAGTKGPRQSGARSCQAVCGVA
ncbi:hypothetical protein D3C76_681090 [compost metagenome]